MKFMLGVYLSSKEFIKKCKMAGEMSLLSGEFWVGSKKKKPVSQFRVNNRVQTVLLTLE
jgi:hypothetical protein